MTPSCGAMMSDQDLLRALLKDEVLAAVEDTSTNKKNVILREPDGSPYDLKILGAPHETIAFKADAFPAPCGFFRGTKKERKRADYVVIAEDVNRSWIVYIEMKRGTDGSKQDIVAKLRGARCLVAYCRAIGQDFWQESQFLETNSYQERFVSVRRIRTSKKEPSWPTTKPRNDRPETLWIFSRPPHGTLRFNELIEGKRSRP